jgi:regulator of protease activity HflC (stomatin/prohibitin superfamily)
MYIDNNGEPKPFKIFGHLFIGILALTLLFSSFGAVSAGERGVKLRFKAVVGTIDEGLYFKIPLIEKVKKMDVKVQKDEVEASAASKDLQTVSSKLAINFNLSPDHVANIYKSVGIDYKIRLIDPAVQESVKAATAKYTAEELITKRELVREDIKLALSERLKEYGIVIDQVNITNFDFSKSFNEAIEAKVTAEQSALAAKNKLEQVKFEAEQRIATAQAEAEAIRIQAAAVTSQGGKDYVSLQWIEKWNGTLPSTVLGSAVPMININ